MRLVLSLFILAATAVARCPLGFSPEEACHGGSPGCALFSDADGNARCDNPGPQPVTDPEPTREPEPVEETGPAAEPEPAEETGPTEEPEPGPVEEPEPHAGTPTEREEHPAEPEASSQQPVEPMSPGRDDQMEASPAVPGEAAETDTGAGAADSRAFHGCPMGCTEERACAAENPGCALFTDTDGNGRCDNPLPGEAPDSAEVSAVPVIGCPLGLPPEAACPGSLAMCPHWFGQSRAVPCSNPSGGGRRVAISLTALSVLMIMSTVLSRRLKGRKPHEKLRRNLACRTVHGLSLIVLGFGIQGCFCPLGAFQYVFLKNGPAFLGWMGVAILVIPFLFASFFGRIFCCWVCPMGAMQELAFQIPSPGKLNPRGRVSRAVGRFRFVVLGAVVTLLLLIRSGTVSVPWPAVFCRLDPFRPIFTLFLSGSAVAAGVTLILSVFVRRFFCRYLCFMGAALSLFSPLRLYSRIRGKKPHGDDCEP